MPWSDTEPGPTMRPLVTPLPTKMSATLALNRSRRLSMNALSAGTPPRQALRARDPPNGAPVTRRGAGAVVRMPNTQLQPDILVYPARFSALTDWRRLTEHWLAVEVLSPSSRIYDREFKRDAYFALGVQQVWLVDWRDESVEVCTSKGKSGVMRDRIRWRIGLTDVVVELREVFAGFAPESWHESDS